MMEIMKSKLDCLMRYGATPAIQKQAEKSKASLKKLPCHQPENHGERQMWSFHVFANAKYSARRAGKISNSWTLLCDEASFKKLMDAARDGKYPALARVCRRNCVRYGRILYELTAWE
jgi:hypothetical protein